MNHRGEPGTAKPHREAPAAADFLEETTRRCSRCKVVKPLDTIHFQRTMYDTFRKSCKRCLGDRYAEIEGEPIEDATDSPGSRPEHAELKRGVWTARDLQPRGDVPITRDWDLICSYCGKTWHLNMTERQAMGMAAVLSVKRARCGQCRGRVWLDMAFTTTKEVIEEMSPLIPDTLSGPDYKRPLRPSERVA